MFVAIGVVIACLKLESPQISTEVAAGTGTVLRPVKRLLAHDNTVEDTRTWKRGGKQHSSIWKEVRSNDTTVAHEADQLGCRYPGLEIAHPSPCHVVLLGLVPARLREQARAREQERSDREHG